MLDKLKEDLICELKDVSKDGVKTGNIEYISKLAETYKNLNKSEKEELESMIYDERLDRRDRWYGREYDSRYGARGRGEYARRDSRGRYADGFRPIEDGYLSENVDTDSVPPPAYGPQAPSPYKHYTYTWSVRR